MTTELELEEVLAWLDESPGAVADAQRSQLSAPGEGGESFMLSVDDEIGGVTVPTTQEFGTFRDQNQRVIPVRAPKKRKQVNPNKARDERRLELIGLQAEVAKLEFTFKRLQSITSSRPSSSHGCEDAPGVPKVWQDICSRQVDRRVTAEWENVQLKQQCEREKQLATSFAKLLFKRWRHDGSMSEAEKQTRRTDIPAGHIERMAAMILNELMAGVQACYWNVDRVFQTGGSAATSAVIHSVLLDGGLNSKGPERKFFDKRVVPFDMHATGAAWWETWHNYRGQQSQDILLDEFIERFGLEMNDFKINTSATAYCQQVSRRYVEDGRIVFVWDAYMEPYGYNNERVGGFYFLEQLYVLVEPDKQTFDEGSQDNNGLLTSVSICLVIKPQFLDPELKDDAKTDAVVTFLSSAAISNIINLRDMTETLLLDRALQQFNEEKAN